MRLWHKDLIPVLPRQQLLAQWRECCCIARNIAVNGTPNHILVNPIIDYPVYDFGNYATIVFNEMKNRGYICSWDKFDIWYSKIKAKNLYYKTNFIFDGWHNDRYLTQCFYNLQEKFDRGGVPADEWERVENFYLAAMKYRIHNHFGMG